MAIVSTFAEAWQQFLRLTTVESADQSRWRLARGRAMLIAFIAPLLDSPLAGEVEALQARLSDLACIEPYPRDLLHITVKLGGFQVVLQTMDDDIPRANLPAIADSAARVISTTPAFTAQVGPINAFPDAVFLEIEDHGQLKDLHLRLCEEVKGLHLYPTEVENYLPHISIARFRSQDDLSQLKKRLAALRVERPRIGEIEIDSIDMARIIMATDPPEIQTLQTTYLLAD